MHEMNNCCFQPMTHGIHKCIHTSGLAELSDQCLQKTLFRWLNCQCWSPHLSVALIVMVLFNSSYYLHHNVHNKEGTNSIIYMLYFYK